MGMLGMIGDAVKGGISGGLTGGISGAISNGIGSMIGGLFGPSQEELQQQQLDYQGKLMALQQTYNRMQADYTHQLSKDMWDYTNYENQVKHLKAAGLNPALFYGKGGAQGASTSGGSAAPVSAGSPVDPYMALNYRKLQAETTLTEAEAAKTREEAKKIAGPDTEKTKGETDLIASQEALNKILEDLNKTGAKLNEAKIGEINQNIENLKAAWKGLVLNNEITEETKEIKIQQMQQDYVKSVYDLITIEKGWEYTAAQTDKIKKEIETIWFNAITARKAAEAAQKSAEASERNSWTNYKSYLQSWDKFETSVEQFLQKYNLDKENSETANLINSVKAIMPNINISFK